MIYVFSSLIVLAGGGILAIVWKHYGSFIKSKVKAVLNGRSLPKVSIRLPKVSLPDVSLAKKTSAFKNKFKKPAVNSLSSSKDSNKAENKQKGVHVSSLLGEKGEQFWIEVIKSDPQNPHPYKKLGEWYLDNNKHKYAVETFKYAAKLDPEDSDIEKYLKDLQKSVKKN